MTHDEDRWRALRRVFRLPVFGKRRIEADVDTELRFHIDGRVEELMEQEHLPRADAEREARRRFGDYESYKQQASHIDDRSIRGRNRMELFDILARETRHAARTLWRARAFSLIAFITLTLGIAAATAIFTVLDAVVLAPLPYRGADQLVAIEHPATVPGAGESVWGLSQAGYFYFKNQNKTLSDMGAYQTGTFTVTDGDRPESVRLAQATASLFTTLRARAEIGRLIDARDDAPHGPDVAVLSYEYWQRRFGGDRGIIGKVLHVDGGALQIIGVAEPGLTLPRPGSFASKNDLAGFGVDVWRPMQLDPAQPPVNAHWLAAIGRLRPGATAEQAQAEFASLMTQFPALFPQAYSTDFMRDYNFRIAVKPLQADVIGPTVERSLWLLFGAVAVVLFIACANVANLFLVRMEARRREAAVRTALGASRGQLAVHYLSESLMLTILAGAAGLVVARVALRALIAIAPRDIPRLASVSVSGTTMLFAAVLALLSGIVFGVMPLFRGDVDIATIREGGRGLTTSPTQRAARAALVVGQVALALVLLAAAGVMLRSFNNLRHVKPGLDPHGVLTFDVSIPWSEYRGVEGAYPFHTDFARRIAALPGVTQVGATAALPLRGMTSGCTAVWPQGSTYKRGEWPCVSTPAVTPDFFNALGIQVHGDLPRWTDIDPTRKRAATVVVTQALANHLWPHEDAIGKGMSIGGDAWVGGDTAHRYYRVVGIIPELRAQGLDKPPTEAALWVGVEHSEEYAVRTSLDDPEALVPRIQQILKDMNPRIAMTQIGTMDEIVSQSVARTTFLMTLLVLAGGMALVLSAVGIYGVISYLVTQRRAEMGIRVALGARGGQVASLVLGESLRLAAAGVAIGLVAAWGANRALRSLLFEVSPTDPWVLVGTAVVLIAIAVAASLAPARRATRVDPVEAMRGA